MASVVYWFNHYNSHNLGHNVLIFADYDRPPGRKLSGEGFSCPPYLVFVVVYKNMAWYVAQGLNHLNQQRKA